MNMEVYCNYCKKSRELRLHTTYREEKIYLWGHCPFCGTYWCKLKGRVSGNREHDNEEWYINYYKYGIKEVKSDGKISSGWN